MQDSKNSISSEYQVVIPDIHHSVWFGSDIPLSVFENIRKIKELNPGFQVILWSDFESNRDLTGNYLALLKEGVEVRNIRDYSSELVNYDLIRQDLDQDYPHYSSACNTLRIDLMVMYGGIYNDASIIPKKSIHSLGELLAQPYLCSMQFEGYREGLRYVGTPDTMGAIPRQPLYILSQKILLEINDHLLKNPTYKRKFLDVTNAEVRYLIGRTRTGLAIAFALECFEITEKPSYKAGIIYGNNVLDAGMLGIPKAQTKFKRSHGDEKSFKEGVRLEKELEGIIMAEIVPKVSLYYSQVIDEDSQPELITSAAATDTSNKPKIRVSGKKGTLFNHNISSSSRTDKDNPCSQLTKSCNIL